MSSDEDLKSKARKRAEAKVGFYLHLGVYVMVNLFLVVIWWLSGDPYPWFIYPLLGWGIAVVIHFIYTYRGQGYVEKMTEDEYKKLKKQES